jgi:transposase InsO family protein
MADCISTEEKAMTDGIRISMSGKGNCYAMVETFFKTLKSELIWRAIFQTRTEAKLAIGRYIDGFHNPVRRHSALDFTSPAQFKRLAVNRPKCSTKVKPVLLNAFDKTDEATAGLLPHGEGRL